jgi:hypothetical protein
VARSPSIAGGGGGSSAAAALPDWELVDVTDGSWTSSDPDGNGRVSSVAVSGNETTVTWNGFTGTSSDAIDGSTFGGLRYYKALTYPDGTAVDLADDGWTIEAWVDTPPVLGSARTQFALGISSVPTSTSTITANFAGLWFSPDHASNYVYIGQIRTNASPLTALNADNRFGYYRSAFAFGKGAQSFAWALRSDGTHTGFNNRSLTNYTGTVYLQLSMGAPDTRVISAGATNAFSVFYRVIRTPIGPAGNAP